MYIAALSSRASLTMPDFDPIVLDCAARMGMVWDNSKGRWNYPTGSPASLAVGFSDDTIAASNSNLAAAVSAVAATDNSDASDYICRG